MENTIPCNGIKKKRTSIIDIPNHIIFDQILSRLRPKLLIQFSCVCKSWAATILRSPCFASMHFLRYSRNNSRLLFRYLNYEALCYDYMGRNVKNRFFYLEKGSIQLQEIATIRSKHTRKLVGFCNGLVCLFNADAEAFEVCNPTRRQILAIFSPPRSDEVQEMVSERHIKCYGFGFDNINNEYKVVLVFENFRCMVFTLGPNSSLVWKQVTIPAEIVQQLSIFSHYCGYNPILQTSVTFCNGSLYWKANLPHQFLLSFNLHKEKFQVIRLAAEFHDEPCFYHLFVYKGSVCDARFEEVPGVPGRPPSCKLHVYMLKDNTGQVWTKETFTLDFSSPVGTKIITFFDEILLSWGGRKGYPTLYNVHTKEQKNCRSIQGLNLSYKIYSLNNYVENILSLQTFLPGGTPNVLGDYPPVKALRKMAKFRSQKASDIAFMFSSSQNPETRTEFYL